jgi:hypothetical protein
MGIMQVAARAMGGHASVRACRQPLSELAQPNPEGDTRSLGTVGGQLSGQLFENSLA